MEGTQVVIFKIVRLELSIISNIFMRTFKCSYNFLIVIISKSIDYLKNEFQKIVVIKLSRKRVLQDAELSCFNKRPQGK